MGQKRDLFGDLEGGNEPQLTVNERFAKRLEHNKAREELHRLEEKHKSKLKGKVGKQSLAQQEGNDRKEEDESSSSSDDEEELDIAAELQDPKFLSMLSGFRKGEKVQEFEEEDSDSDSENEISARQVKRKRPILLKDMARDLSEAQEDSSSEDEFAKGKSNISQTYHEELEGVRNDLLQAVNSEENGDEADLFGKAEPKNREENEHSTAFKKRKVDTQEMLDSYFGKDEELDKDDLFLKRFISDKDVGGGGENGDDMEDEMDDEEDEKYLEAAEKFEAEHNFRFEEQGADRLRTYPREIEGAVRQGDTKRAEARRKKKERKQQERAKQEAEIQRLKTLKRREIEERMTEIQESAGLRMPNEAILKLLDKEDFNEDEYDQIMAQAFDENYYKAEGDDARFGSEDHDEFPEEEEPIVTGGFRATQRDVLASLQKPGKERDAEEVKRLLEEYNKLEYEDIVAGMPTRFRYHQVSTDDFGLDTNDILALNDKELNQVVGLRRLAPYREEHKSKKRDRHAQMQLKMITKPAHKDGPGKEAKQEAGTQSEKAQEDHRKATYARPTLHSKKEKKIDFGKSEDQRAKQSKKEDTKPISTLLENFDTSKLTKAQKKNLRRSLKRKNDASN